MAQEKREHIGLLARTFRRFNPVIVFEDRPYTWHSDVDMTKGNLDHVDVEEDIIDNDHLKYTSHETDRGVKSVTEFNHAVAGPVKDAKLIASKDKTMGEQSDHIGVYTLATKEEFDSMKPKLKAQVTCPKYLTFVGAGSAFEAAANDEPANTTGPLLLLDEDRVNNKPAGPAPE
ncbi:MAG: hypothetical protein ACLFR0_02885 [Alphaproteobacteria bacterium]